MSQHDYIMDQIEMLGDFFRAVIRRETKLEYGIYQEEDGVTVSKRELNKRRLLRLIHDGRINQAEDLLFDIVKEQPDEENAKLVLWFYQEVSALDDLFLSTTNYTRDEMIEGMREIKKYYTGKNIDDKL